MPNDPLPPSEPWIDKPLTAEELKALRVRLAKMRHEELMKFYAAALEMCQFSRGKPPRAPFIQQLVQAWKEMQRRRKASLPK